MLRKTFSLLLAVLIIVSAAFPAFAAGSIYADPVEIGNNRRFDVLIRSDSEDVLTAAAFSLKYDKSRFAYREVSTPGGESSVWAKENDGEVKVIFLNPSGIKPNEHEYIAAVKFKSLLPGSGSIEITSSDCVDGDARDTDPLGSCVCDVNVLGTDEKSPSGRTGTGSKNSSRASSRSGSRSSSEKSSDPATIPSRFSRRSSKDYTPLILALSVAGALAVSATAVIALIRSDKSHPKGKKKDPREDEDNKE